MTVRTIQDGPVPDGPFPDDPVPDGPSRESPILDGPSRASPNKNEYTQIIQLKFVYKIYFYLSNFHFNLNFDKMCQCFVKKYFLQNKWINL